MTSATMRVAAIAAAPVLLVGLGACSSSSSSDPSASPSGGGSSSAAPSDCATPGASTTPAPVTKDNVKVSGALNVAPTISVVAGNRPPKQLVSEDIAVGCGEAVAAGATVTVNYEGVLYENGTTFDSSWEGGQPISFPLTKVIPCWRDGVVGMKVGGRRMLICPPDTAYGVQGAPPSVPSEATLVFVVDLNRVGSAASAAAS